MKMDAVAAVATPVGTGGVSMIRISGDNALEVADACFRTFSGEKLSDSPGYRAYYGKVFDAEKPIDEAVCLVFRAPHSYTGENVAEISCHGGIFITQKILKTVLSCGASPAAPGEFTKRAFLNGKLDLSKAESVMTLISARGEQGANAAFNLLEGSLHKKITEINASLVSAAAHLAAWVDYPDEEIEELDSSQLKTTVSSASAELEKLLAHFDSGMAITAGVDAAIVGKPNVGKSTLMNLMTGTDRSIVTELEGTTRDVIEETVELRGCILRISDTAGIRDTEDKVEKLGVERSRKRLERAALIFAVFDGSAPLSDEDRALIDMCRGKKTLPIVNKSDLKTEIDISIIETCLGSPILLSAKNGSGFDELCDAVVQLLGTADFDTTSAMLATERQRLCCEKAKESLDEAVSALDSGMTNDAVGVCIDGAISALLELTGQRANDAVINEVFSKFCVGK